jgi:hypothetical protein
MVKFSGSTDYDPKAIKDYLDLNGSVDQCNDYRPEDLNMNHCITYYVGYMPGANVGLYNDKKIVMNNIINCPQSNGTTYYLRQHTPD